METTETNPFGSIFSDFSWVKAPIIVGGTGGSGTRGVVDVLDKLGIYMHPGMHTQLFKECFNGDAIDNVAMYPESGLLEGMEDNGKYAKKSYTDWLMSDTCQPREVVVPFVISSKGHKYLDSIPESNRKRHRWGWKNPKTIYHLEVLLSMYPDMLFVQVVRNPFDMAAVQFEHLHNRALEFSELHGGFEEAAGISNLRCLKVSPQNPKACLLNAKALSVVSQCRGSGRIAKNAAECAKRTDITKPGPWRCLEMQLWAQINSAAYVYGVRCLNQANKFLVWHGEDVYGLRGEAAQLQLQHRISDMLDIEVDSVSKVFKKSKVARHRRLGYGKYKEVGINLSLAYSCAESAVPGGMQAFHYQLDETDDGEFDYSFNVDRNQDSTDSSLPVGDELNDKHLNDYLFWFSVFILTLLWCRRKNLAQPNLDTIDLLTS